MGEWDEVELYPEVTVGRAGPPAVDAVAKGGAPNSVMADAPTIALRPAQQHNLVEGTRPRSPPPGARTIAASSSRPGL